MVTSSRSGERKRELAHVPFAAEERSDILVVREVSEMNKSAEGIFIQERTEEALADILVSATASYIWQF